MRAAVYRGIRDIAVEEVPDPQPGPDEALVAVKACGICGSDLHSFLHGSFVEPGQIMGHEFVGVVLDTGVDVEGLDAGDRVTAVPIVGCMACARCREGRFNLCDTAWTTAIAYGRPGGFADKLTIPQVVVGGNVFKLPDNVSDEAGALIEPLAVAVHAVKLAPGVEGATALVLGLGTIGLQVVQVLRAAGARRVIGIDVSDLRIDTASRLGAEAVSGAGGIAAALAPLIGEDDEVDLVFECSGVPALADAAIGAVRAGGTIVVIALYDEPVTLDPSGLVQREIRLQGSIAYTSEDFRDALELLASGRARSEPLITQREPLGEIGPAFDVQLEKERSVKVLVLPADG